MSNQRSTSKSSIEKLVRFFEKNIYQLKSPNFNETQARQQLIDPLFEALGWDVHNRKMNPLYLQEVMPEGRVKTNVGKEVKEQELLFEKKGTLGKAQKEYASILDYIAEDNYKASWKEAIKKPDYRFRIKGQTKFFVEAKKPFVDLSKSNEAIFQVKRYGFSGRVPVSILTDFEQFRTFDCTHRPEFDKPKLGVIKELDLTYIQYLDQFDQIFDTFSHDAVEAGSLDTLTRKLLQKKTGDFALDKHFLEDLSAWREELARDIAKHPKNRRRLTDYTLNESVQRILDRIVFFRVCEDREIEVENTLLAILRLWQGRPGVSLYSLLNDLFKQRRALYNGLLFAPHECEELEVGDDVLLKILEGLNYPFSPYYFNEIGVEILGSIYEKFLGKTIHLTPKTVRVDEKPEVRKAGGVYYTPQYIVNYIVDNTVGKLLYEDVDGNGGKRKLKLSPKQVSKLKIIDIACGSGSFLLGAFQKLTDYHLEWYRDHPKDVETYHNVPDAYGDANGLLRLSSRKKRDILLNNIFGVDIDRQAVEVTQMSLYLKVLEGENAETLNPQMMLALKEAYLPSLGNNIKCGNSLVGTDILAQADLFDSESTQKLNPFDWEVEFSEILKTGGFQVVVGNPPWGIGFDELQLQYLRERNREIVVRMIDSFMYFVYRGITILGQNGHFGMILPDVILYQKDNLKLRRYLLENSALEKVINLGNGVFQKVTRPTCILTLSKNTSKRSAASVIDLSANCEALGSDSLNWTIVPQSQMLRLPDLVLVTSSTAGYEVLSATQRLPHRKLQDFVDGDGIQRGVSPDLKEAFIVDAATAKKHKLERSHLRRVVTGGRQVKRYGIEYDGRLLVYTGRDTEFNEIPGICKFIDGFKSQITCQEVSQRKHSLYSLHRARDETIFLKEKKILGVITEDEIKVAVDDQKLFATDGIYLFACQGIDPYFLVGVLNSKLFVFLYRLLSLESGRVLAQVKPTVISELPIRAVDLGKPGEKRVHDDIATCANTMITLHEQIHKAAFDSEKEPIRRQIAATDKKIDKLVYELYGLTEEEIKIVEGGDVNSSSTV